MHTQIHGVRSGAIVLATMAAMTAALAAPASSAPAPGGLTAPSFSLPARGGGVAALDSLRGKVVLVDFWASWCGPCRRSFPWLSGLHERLAAKGLAIVAINLDKAREPADAFLAKFPARFTVAFDPAGKTAEAYRAQGMPSTFLIGPTGKILHSHVGFDEKKAKALETLIEEALKR